MDSEVVVSDIIVLDPRLHFPLGWWLRPFILRNEGEASGRNGVASAAVFLEIDDGAEALLEHCSEFSFVHDVL